MCTHKTFGAIDNEKQPEYMEIYGSTSVKKSITCHSSDIKVQNTIE